jgi:hypothetical protein
MAKDIEPVRRATGAVGQVSLHFETMHSMPMLAIGVGADKMSRPEQSRNAVARDLTQDLLMGLLSLAVALGLLFVGLPKRGESPPFLQFQAAPMIYPAAVLVFLAIGFVELISWAVS